MVAPPIVAPTRAGRRPAVVSVIFLCCFNLSLLTGTLVDTASEGTGRDRVCNVVPVARGVEA